MPSEPDDAREVSQPAPRRSRLLSVLILALVGALGLLLGRATGDEPAEVREGIEIAPTPSVVVGLRELSRLEGMVVHVERVIDLRERQSVLFDLVGVEDAILLIAGGEVTAGVDLRALGEESVEASFEERRARVLLPRATVFSRRLDNDRTYVHTRTTDLLATRRDDLETRARREAERVLESAALEAGILEKAEASVARTVEGLLRSLGFEEIEVRFGESPGLEALDLTGPG